jgi:hypothetical protein
MTGLYYLRISELEEKFVVHRGPQPFVVLFLVFLTFLVIDYLQKSWVHWVTFDCNVTCIDDKMLAVEGGDA